MVDKYYFLILIIVCVSCGQTQTDVPIDDFSKRHNGYSESHLNEVGTSNVPVSMVRNLSLDKNGNVLIAASRGGVFRYDGISFTNLTSNMEDPHRFWDVLEDRFGNLWFASTDSGVSYYDGISLRHFTTKDGLASNMVMFIYEDRAGNIWFSGDGLTRYDGKSFRQFTTRDGLPQSSFRDITEDKSGNIWIATADGPSYYDGKTFTVVEKKNGKAFKNVWSIMEDKRGSIWFGDVDGLWRFDGDIFTQVSQRGAYSILEDKKGNIWTTGGVNSSIWALSRYDASSLYDEMPTVTDILSGPPAYHGLLEADNGSIWFGSGDGVYRYDGKTITDFKSKDGQN